MQLKHVLQNALSVCCTTEQNLKFCGSGVSTCKTKTNLKLPCDFGLSRWRYRRNCL